MAAFWSPSSKSGEMGFSPTSSYSLHEMCIRMAIIRPSLICQVSKSASLMQSELVRFTEIVDIRGTAHSTTPGLEARGEVRCLGPIESGCSPVRP
jgi:hypothetical protein